MPYYLDLETWPRREVFDFYRHFDKPYFNVCLRLDVTNLLAELKAREDKQSVWLTYHYFARRAGGHDAVSSYIATTDVFLQRTVDALGNIERRLSNDLVLLGQGVSCNIGRLDANTGVALAKGNLQVAIFLGFVTGIVGGDDPQDVVAFR